MPAIYRESLKNTRMNDVTADAGATAVLEIGTSGMASVLATIALDNPIAAGAVATVLTLSGFPKSDTSADNTGTAAAARIRTSSGGTDVVTGLTVGLTGDLSGSDISLDSLSITAGQTVKVNSAAITHAP